MIISFQARAFALARMAAIQGVEICAKDSAKVGSSTNSGGTGKPGPIASTAKTAPRLRGWDKPIICEMPYARRMSGYTRQERASEAGRRDGSLLSSAIAAIDRAYRLFEDPDPMELARILASAGEDLEQIRGLWFLESEGPDYPEEMEDGGEIPTVPENPDGRLGDGQNTGKPPKRPKSGDT